MNHNRVTFVHQNIQCLANKLLDLNFIMESQTGDFLLLSEHWLNTEYISEVKLRDFTLCSSFCRRALRHGGVAIYKRDSCNYCTECLDLFEYCVEGTFECAGLVVADLKLILVVVYRPPNGLFTDFLKYFDCVLNNLFKKSLYLVIAGDFNLNFAVPSFNLSLFNDLLCTFNLLATIKESTRITGTSSTCIDNFLVSAPLLHSSLVVDLGLSDHYAQVLVVDVDNILFSPKSETQYAVRRNFCRNNINRFAEFIKTEDWADVYSQSCPDSACQSLFGILSNRFEQCFPLSKQRLTKKPVKSKIRVLPPELQQLKKMITLYNDLCRVDSRYKEIVNKSTKIYRERLREHVRGEYDGRILKSSNKSKSMWNFIREVKKENHISKIKICNNGVQLSDESVAENFNCHFSTISANQDTIDYKFIEACTTLNQNTCFLSPVCTLDVLDLITALKSSNSAGFDGISNNLIKRCKLLLCDVLTFVINLSVAKGQFPDCLKLAIVIPLFKKGDPNDYSNYRAISLLSCVSKIFELNLRNQMLSFLQKYNFFNASQHGFTQSKSTESALCDFQIRIVDALDKNLSVVGLFVDFSRAFDLVNHDILLAKLHRCGFRGKSFDLISSYLCSRRQYVTINNKQSKCSFLTTGVPQGSIIGPFLFLVFANDLLNFIEQGASDVRVTAYADDTNILIIDRSTDAVIKKTEIIYDRICLWSQKNHLTLNINKTNFVQFSNNRSSLGEIGIFEGKDNALSSCSTSKMLGITFDCGMNWQDHINILSGRLRKSCYALKFMANHFKIDVLLSLYYANFHSHLRYGILNWGLSAHVSRIFLVQKYAIRIMTGIGPRQSCRPMFKKLGILPLSSVYIYQVCVFVFKNKTKFETYRTSHSHNTRNKDQLLPNYHRTGLYQKGIFFNGCKFYNRIDDSIKKSPNVNVFKSRLKRLLLERNCYSVEEFLDVT